MSFYLQLIQYKKLKVKEQIYIINKSSSTLHISTFICSSFSIYMLTDSNHIKVYKSKTQPTQQIQNNHNQTELPYVNPIIKHTLDSLPIIYGGNLNRKRKYKVFMKSKFQLDNIISKAHDKNYLPNQRLYKRLNELDQSRHRGNSCLQMNSKKQKLVQSRDQITKTVMKKNKRISTSPGSQSGKQLTHQALSTPNKNKKTNLQAMHMLSKPKDKCHKQYCSCKSLYEEYQQEVNKKLRQKLKKVNLPRLSTEHNNNSPSKLDDQQSKHKVKFKYKMNSGDINLGSQQGQNNNDQCCYLCQKHKQPQKASESKGILGLIKKKQLQQRNSRLAHYSNTYNIGSQSNQNYKQLYNEDCAVQADFQNSQKKLKTIDQQINTDFDQQKAAQFKHLQNNKNLKDSNLRQNKKQPLEHLSHLKEKYKYKKRPSYQSKHDNDGEDSDEQNNNQGINSRRSQLKRLKKGKHQEQSDQFDINMESQSQISQNSMMNHLADALVQNGKDRSTIFRILKNKQKQLQVNQDQLRGSKSKYKDKLKGKKSKPMKLIDQDTGLFAIPQQQQYVDYLTSYQPIQKDFKVKNLLKSQNFKILKYKDTLYFGQATADNTKNGQALTISPKQIFEGVYKNGIKMSGCERNIDGVYMGQFLNGMRHGQGKWIWNNGQIYQGQWKLGTKNGWGIWKSPKGDSYEGEWVMNRQQGKGIHKHKSSVYEGQFVQALKQGQGRQKYINGDQYIGQYYKGKPHGKGKYIWKNGAYYEGQFKDGLRQGKGIWYYSKKAYYQGQFRNDFKHGYGKQVFENGDQYQGQFSENIKTKGTFKQFSTGKVSQIKAGDTSARKQQKLKQKQKSKQNILKHQIKSTEQKNNKSSSKINDYKAQFETPRKQVKNKQTKQNKQNDENNLSLKNSKVQIQIQGN